MSPISAVIAAIGLSMCDQSDPMARSVVASINAKRRQISLSSWSGDAPRDFISTLLQKGSVTHDHHSLDRPEIPQAGQRHAGQDRVPAPAHDAKLDPEA